MDEIWERAVETALDGQADHAAARTLTLDGAVKCVQGRLPPASLLEKFENLQHLSIANIGVSSLEQFPRLRNLQKLILSDNRIAGGLEFLVEAGLDSLRDLDLSNNRIQYIEDLAPLAQLKLVSLDLYECPVTRVKDYRSRVFGLIKSLKYLDKMDAEENERPESDDEEEDDEEDDDDDPGSGEIDGEDRPYRMDNGHNEGGEGIVDVDEDEESDADEEETETGRRVNEHSEANGFRIEEVGRDEDDDDDDDYSGEEVDDDEEEDDVVEVHEIGDSDDEEDGVEDDDDDEDDEDDEEEEVDNDEGEFAEPESTGRLTSTEGEIDGHEHGEDDGDDDDDIGETGEEEQGVEDDGEFEDEEEGEEEDEDFGEGYLVQPVGQAEEHDAGGSDMDPGNEEDDAEEEEVEDDEEVQVLPSSSQLKRKRSDDAEEDKDGEDDEEEDDVVEFAKASKKHR
ncbi:hypothetical protein CRYUN_Cryun22dG0110000 [Craigia yunnanensis]